MNFNSSNSSIEARRARIKEWQAQGRVYNSAMRAKAIREAKRMQEIEDKADNIIAGLQYNPNVKREVVKVEPIEYIDTTGFDIVNLGSADKDAYSNSRRAEYSKNKKLENMADAILKELQSDSDEDDNIDEEKMDAILNSIREEDADDNNNDDDDNNDIDEEKMDSILNSIREEDADDNNNDEDETDEDNYIEEEVIVEDDNIDEEKMDAILNSIREEDDEKNDIEEEMIIEEDNNTEIDDSGYYEYSKLQERIVNYIVKHGSYDMKKDEYHKFFNEIQPLIEMNIVDKLIGEGGDMITLFEY